MKKNLKSIEDIEKNERYELLAKTFEELLVDKIALAELRNFWRHRAGLPQTDLKE